MKVREVMIVQVITLSPSTTYEEAAGILHKNGISGAPVIDESGKLLGIVSEKDLFRAMYPLYEEYILEPHAYYNQEIREDEVNTIRKQPIEKYMSARVVAVNPDDSVLHAGGLMLAHGFHRLPVMEGEKLIGIVSREDIYGAILKKHMQA